MSCKPTCFYDGRLVAWTDGEHLEDTARCPEKLLIGVGAHDANKIGWASTCKNDQLRKMERNRD